MDRRALLGTLAGGLLAAPLAANAQQAGKVYRVGLLSAAIRVSDMAGPEPVNPALRAFVQGLRALGYVEGQNLVLERRSIEGRNERADDLVAELVRLRPDVIVTSGNPAARAAKAATTTVPVVTVLVGDPVADGLVQSLARPGGNITGLTVRVGPEIEAKRLELLKELRPDLSRVAYLGSKENKDWEAPWGKSVRAAAQALGVTLVLAEFSPRQYTDAFNLIARAQVEALLVGPSPAAYVDGNLIVDFVTRTRLPSVFAFRESVDLGGLMSYGVNVADIFRRAAGYVDKILRGARPAELPVDQPSNFEFVMNLKAARVLGLTVPQAMLLRADAVIQ